jgi:deoxyribonuclease V
MATIACLDVAYRNSEARAACALAESWQAELPASRYVCDIESVEPYEPGKFYRRELPCLLSVLKLLPAPPDFIVIDGYVWLASESRPGLGAHLHAALGGKTPVIGIAKTPFVGVDACPSVVQVLRGASKRPLFVTAIGVEPAIAGECVLRMAGKHRIPELLKASDQLSRTKFSVSNDAA